MEDTLRAMGYVDDKKLIRRLNPCFNGRYSQSCVSAQNHTATMCLNPCFNGRYSQSDVILSELFMYVCLNPCFNGRYSQRSDSL